MVGFVEVRRLAPIASCHHNSSQCNSAKKRNQGNCTFLQESMVWCSTDSSMGHAEAVVLADALGDAGPPHLLAGLHIQSLRCAIAWTRGFRLRLSVKRKMILGQARSKDITVSVATVHHSIVQGWGIVNPRGKCRVLPKRNSMWVKLSDPICC